MSEIVPCHVHIMLVLCLNVMCVSRDSACVCVDCVRVCVLIVCVYVC